jgi:hypothetical protein
MYDIGPFFVFMNPLVKVIYYSYWTFVMAATTHRFLLFLTPAALVEAHPDILSATEFPIMLELGSSNKSQATAYVADILSLICCLSKYMRYQSDANTIIISDKKN